MYTKYRMQTPPIHLPETEHVELVDSSRALLLVVVLRDELLLPATSRLASGLYRNVGREAEGAPRVGGVSHRSRADQFPRPARTDPPTHAEIWRSGLASTCTPRTLATLAGRGRSEDRSGRRGIRRGGGAAADLEGLGAGLAERLELLEKHLRPPARRSARRGTPWDHVATVW